MAFIGSQGASSSSSMPDDRCPYRVFLSFRGADTRKTFTDHLHKALEGAGLRTFLDDEGIERGENIGLELERAINESRSSIIVFSQNYASSKWCLDELVLIMKRKSTTSTSISDHFLVLPVFYHVDPSHVRYQTGTFKERFDRYESEAKADCTGQWMDRLKGWKEALGQAANLGGMNIENQAVGHEAAFIEKIVSYIKGKVENRMLCLPPYLIGIDHKVQKINWWLQDGSTDVGILAICGMGGIGKTTSARYAFNLNRHRFKSSCFLSDIKDAYKNFPHGIMDLQKQLISDLLFGKEKNIKSIDHGVHEIGIALQRKKVLIVFDDVEEKEQLDAIIGMRNMFYEGSKIIITTRHLRLHKPSINDQAAYRIHNVEKMDIDESLELFSWHAFDQDHPAQGYEELSKRITLRCDGLPLALQVIGSFLSRKDAVVWEDALTKLQDIPDTKVLDKLKVSYDGLQDDHDRNLFLDIACFFIGEDRNHTVTILNACGNHTIIGLDNLMERCLLRVDMNNRLVMHQMLQDMGREVSRREQPNDPGKRHRLWCHKDSCKVLEEDTGTEAIEGLVVDMHLIKEDKKVLSSNIAKRRRLNFFTWPQLKNESDSWNEILLKAEAFRRMHKLKILHINYSEMRGNYSELPKKIQWFRWDGCPLQFIPSNFPLERSVAVEIRRSDLKAGWEGNKVLGVVKILDLSHTHGLSKTPNFSRFPKLERLIMKNCSSLAEVDESIGKLENSLIFLDLEDCRSLRELPRNTAMLHVLETLIVSGCSNLEELPANMEKMKSLKTFKLDRLMINQEVTSSYATTMLDASWHAFAQRYWVSRPRKIMVLSWESLPCSLVSLSLGSCNLTNKAFPMDFGNLPSLQEINLSGNPICFLPDCIRGLARLRVISFKHCTMLQSLIGLPDIDFVDAYGCIELKKVTYKSRIGRRGTDIVECCKLVDMEPFFELSPVASTETELFSPLSLNEIESTTSSAEMTLYHNTTKTTRKGPVQVVHEVCGLYSIFYPGSQVPDWLSCKSDSTSPSLSTTMPSCLRTETTNSNTTYSMNVCFVYSARAQDWEQIYVVISNETKDLKLIYGPTCFGCKDEDHEDMIWISYWKLRENMLEPGDELNFSLLAAASLELKVKEIGVKVSIDDQVPHEDMPQTSNREKKVSGRSGDTRIFAYGTLRDTVKSLLNDIGVIWDLPSSEFIVFV